jgi:4-amino-4-deoxy-L-arabinose transferase-like glycosyltransferase
MQRHWPLVAIVAAYLALGGLFAARMPAWQTPDEPAHYNYTRQLVQRSHVPVIEPADWDAALVPIGPTQRDVPVDRLMYEDHQPPLFYALAAPIYSATGGNVVWLRLFSLLLGAMTVVFAYLTVIAIFPGRPYLAAFTAAFVGLLPQHVFILSGFNNDSLAEAVLALTLWQGVRLIRDQDDLPNSQVAALAIIVGVCFWTKATAYLAYPVGAYAMWRTCWSAPDARRKAWSRLARYTLIAGLIGLPWWIHNLQTYGGFDVLGLTRHNQVVAGQPTTAEWLAQFGSLGVLARLLQTTFQSFWGQFGWMSILLPGWLYLGVLALTLLSAALFVVWWVGSRRARTAARAEARAANGEDASGRGVTERQSRQLTLLALLALLTLLAFIWYNAQFVQHQGRYLFPALIPVGLALGLGWSVVVARWPILLRWLWLAPLVILAALDFYALFRVALPQMGV